MIGYLRGQVLENRDGRMIVSMATGDSGAVGYLVSVPQSAAYGAHAAGRPVELFVYTHVREDALDLYGFATQPEKELFLMLLSVNGIGPRGALGILSSLDSERLVTAILEGDKLTLTKIPGVGKKTAERVVLELADSLRKKIQAGQFTEGRAHGGAVRPPSTPSFEKPTAVRDAHQALIGLGYREQDVVTLLERAVESNPGALKAEDLVRTALQRLS